MTSRAVLVAVLGAVTLAVVAVPALASAPLSASADDGSGSIDITVTVSPAPVEPGVATGGGSSGTGTSGGTFGGSGTSGGGSSTVVTGPTTAPADAVLPPDGFDLGGILYLSGLTTTTTLSPNPFGGTAHSYFTVRNVSGTTLTASARFWLDGPVGNQLSEVRGIAITDLKPDESRVVDATLTGLGQWTFATAHATLTPPKVVEGTELAPITRDSFIVMTPWLVGAAAGVGAATVGALSLIRRPGFSFRLGRRTA